MQRASDRTVDDIVVDLTTGRLLPAELHDLDLTDVLFCLRARQTEPSTESALRLLGRTVLQHRRARDHETARAWASLLVDDPIACGI
ncbi:hypothetical protein [Aliiruegeria sabulilitoris]|uniref:hypothetical protein n=1 Tax=Aliiruegeria sabulilitoris TaxID=1510458 RepID=UPI00082D0ADC|nr:hypothetical protein [Aliiruegeria sabulilitoris]NDR55304.1 hypothetical protein [Pseudoruegeria sp. M32A2M]